MPRSLPALAAALVLAAGAGLHAAPAHAAMTCSERSGALLDDMVAGHFDKAVAEFDHKLAAKLSATKMKTYWSQITTQAGPYKSRGMPSTSKIRGYTVITTPMAFSKMKLNAQVACDSKNQVAGLHFLPAASKSAGGHGS